MQTRAREQARAVLGDAPAGRRGPRADAVRKTGSRGGDAPLSTSRIACAQGAGVRDQLSAGKSCPGNLFPNIYALHRHQLLWDHPDAFDPEHFAPERVERRDRYQYLPFGAGPRICVGANFAMMQAHIILSTLFARSRFDPFGPDPTPVMHMTVRPDPGVTLVATPLPEGVTSLDQSAEDAAAQRAWGADRRPTVSDHAPARLGQEISPPVGARVRAFVLDPDGELDRVVFVGVAVQQGIAAEIVVHPQRASPQRQALGVRELAPKRERIAGPPTMASIALRSMWSPPPKGPLRRSPGSRRTG